MVTFNISVSQIIGVNVVSGVRNYLWIDFKDHHFLNPSKLIVFLYFLADFKKKYNKRFFNPNLWSLNSFGVLFRRSKKIL